MKILFALIALLIALPAMSHDVPFFIDVDRVSEIARNTVHDTFTGIPSEDLIFEQDSLFAYCNPFVPSDEAGRAAVDPDPCFMQVVFSMPESAEETSYIDDFGKCTTVTGSNTITVMVRSDGTAQATVGGSTGKYTSPCTEEFFEKLD